MMKLALLWEDFTVRKVIVTTVWESAEDYPGVGLKIDVTTLPTLPQKGDVYNPDMGTFTQPMAPVVTVAYSKYTYVEFLEKLLESPASAAKLVREKKKDSDLAANIEIMMEMIKEMSGVDFNSPVSRARLNGLVGIIFTPAEASAIIGGTV